MKPIVREALRMIADAELAGKTWPQVKKQQELNRNEDVDGYSFCAVMLSCWVYANLANLVLKDNEAALRAFIEHVDPWRLVRDKFPKDADPCVEEQ